ncbi:kelch-like protein 24, partial [Biomphalaria glabrata]
MTWAQIAAQTLLQGLNGRLKSGQFCDVMIYVDDVEFPCHRVILCAYSDYFQAMFSSGMQEAITQSVKLNDVSHQ